MPRGQVTRTYKDVSVLAGFMDETFFRAFARDHIASLTPCGLQELLAEVERAKSFVSNLAETDLSGVEIQPVETCVVARIEAEETFRAAYSKLPHRFAWINPRKLVALQVSRQVSHECVPTNRNALLDFALPTNWTVPAEISFVPPYGPIYVISSSPQLTGFQLSLDPETGHVQIGPNGQVNLIQAICFKGRYYLRNGYHRVVAAIEAGVHELPALIVDAQNAAQVELTDLGLAGLKLKTSMSLPRPPLVADFASEASVIIRMREKRYGACISLQAAPINIPV